MIAPIAPSPIGPTTSRRAPIVGRSTVAVAFALLLPVACGDDANDQELRARRAADLAAEYRAGQTADVAAEPTVDDLGVTADDGGDGAVAETVATETVAIETVPAASIEPTGVVVPVTALDNSFRPEVIEIAVGDEVVWENRGLNEHNVLRVEGEGWGVEVDAFQPGDVYAHVFSEPGEYRYFCSIHGNEVVGMIGTVVVTG